MYSRSQCADGYHARRADRVFGMVQLLIRGGYQWYLMVAQRGRCSLLARRRRQLNRTHEPAQCPLLDVAATGRPPCVPCVLCVLLCELCESERWPGWRHVRRGRCEGSPKGSRVTCDWRPATRDLRPVRRVCDCEGEGAALTLGSKVKLGCRGAMNRPR
ncbi:hypothetical protein EJ04DRAFT_145270 [Polyplosphaeria fusca]|uniref:Uncharacterized protein n=1 Tax=Polyplosphaeria fusca TaxID=682080 RepID=A0A9P4UVU9_9PLEO|nr:hypothetical protein EJ04DRAFT_145270 [Polyplosphaeria fusca]